MHSGAFESLDDEGFACSLDDAGTDEDALGTEEIVAHGLAIFEEVVQRLFSLFGLVLWKGATGGADQGVDFSVPEFAGPFLPEPAPRRGVPWVDQLGQRCDVLG